MKKWQVALLLLFLLALATTVFAAAPDPDPARSAVGFGRPSRPGALHHGFRAYLGLTKEQLDGMPEVRSRYYADTHDLRYDILQKRLEVRKLFTDPTIDDTTLLAKQKELSALRLKLMERKAQMRIEWRKILTPEQIRKLDRASVGNGVG